MKMFKDSQTNFILFRKLKENKFIGIYGPRSYLVRFNGEVTDITIGRDEVLHGTVVNVGEEFTSVRLINLKTYVERVVDFSTKDLKQSSPTERNAYLLIMPFLILYNLLTGFYFNQSKENKC